LFLLLLTPGCLATGADLNHVRRASPPARVEGSLQIEHQDRIVPALLDVTVGAQVIQGRLVEQPQCRKVEHFRQRVVTRTDSSLSASGKTNQYINVALAVTAATVGTILLARDCRVQDAQTGFERDCTLSETATFQGVSTGILISSAVPVAFLVVNAVKANHVDIEEQTTAGADASVWLNCDDAEPLGDEAVLLVAGTIKLGEARTDHSGRFTLVLPTNWPEGAPFTTQARLRYATIQSPVDLAPTPLAARVKLRGQLVEQENVCRDALISGRFVPVSEDVRAASNEIRTGCDAETTSSGLLGLARTQFTKDCVARRSQSSCHERRLAYEAGRDPLAEYTAEKEARREKTEREGRLRAAAAEKERRQKMAASGWKAKDSDRRARARALLLEHVKAPATTLFVSEKYLGCPGGIEASFVVDSQNSGGALLRGGYCVNLLDNPAESAWPFTEISEGSCSGSCGGM